MATELKYHPALKHGIYSPTAVLSNENAAEFRKLQHEVLQDAVLLPFLETRVLKIRGERAENLDAVVDVEIDMLRRAPRYVRVAFDDGRSRALLEGEHRHDAVGERHGYYGCRLAVDEQGGASGELVADLGEESAATANAMAQLQRRASAPACEGWW